jgi:DNA-binding response OmpR family regulator
MTPTVLVVDDEPDVADTYALKLEAEYETEVAHGGEAALEAANEEFAAVLLDRRMPDIHGDDVLAAFRERGLDFPVIMVTAVDPDLNILEMDFDDYLCKPVDKDTLLSTLDQHVDEESDTDPRLEEFFSIMSKLSVLEEEFSPSQLDDHTEYQKLRQRATELGTELDAEIPNFEELVRTHQSIQRGSTGMS